MEVSAIAAVTEPHPITIGSSTIASSVFEDAKIEELNQPATDTDVIEVDDIEVASSDQEDGSKAKGVLRLLQEGHFRGVADVRLRINFHDEISALQAEKTAEAATNGIADITETLQGELTAFLEADSHEEDVLTSINAASETMFESFESLAQVDAREDSFRTSDVISSMQAAFDEFISSISIDSEDQPIEDPLVTEEPDVTIGTLAAAAEEIEEPTVEDALNQFISGITEIFSAKLTAFESMLNELSVLPELSEPNGQGKAYNKFLSIYNDLYYRAVDSESTRQVDAVA